MKGKENMKNYYKNPVQVIFSYNGEEYLAGIAFHDWVICACCGGLLDMAEVEILEVFEEWVDLSQKIVP